MLYNMNITVSNPQALATPVSSIHKEGVVPTSPACKFKEQITTLSFSYQHFHVELIDILINLHQFDYYQNHLSVSSGSMSFRCHLNV